MNNYIRKIDELGRIVIPKEVRNKLKITDNENILIKQDNNKIIISKYSYLSNYQKFIYCLCNSVTEIYKVGIIIRNLEKEIFNNKQDNQIYLFEEDIIKDSIVTGQLAIYSTQNDDYKKLAKLISRIITDYLENV